MQVSDRELALSALFMWLAGFLAGLVVGLRYDNCSPAPTPAQGAVHDWLLPTDSVTNDLRALTLVVGDRLAYKVIEAAGEQGLDPKLVGAIIWVESRGEPDAVSFVGATGLMQVMPDIWLGVYPECGTDLFDPETNLCYGTRILRYYLAQTQGDTALALHLYSGGARRYAAKVSYRREAL